MKLTRRSGFAPGLTPLTAHRLRLALDVVLVAVLFVGMFRLYRASPGLAQMADGCYSLAVTESLLRDGTVRLDAHLPADPAGLATLPGYDPQTGIPYHLLRLPDPARGSPGGFYYGYPLGSSLLSAPLVAYYTGHRGFSAFGPDGRYSLAGETALHLRVTAVVTAAVVVVFFLIARAFTPAGVAFLLAGGFGVGSMAWSTLSRCLWSHTWAVLLTGLAVLVLVRLARRPAATLRGDLGYGVALGALMFGIYFVRPQAVLSGFAVLAYLALWDRRVLLAAGLTGAACVGALAAWSSATFGTLLPPTVYSPGALDGKEPLARFTGLMVSPSRGLLVFCPYLVAFAYLLSAYRRTVPSPRLLLPTALAVGGYVAMFTAYLGWHGGYCYGPRYFSDILPWFALAGAMGLGAMIDSPGPIRWRKVAEAAVLAGCFAWAGFVHGRGATSYAAWEWNYTCRADAEHVRLISDWQHPQFLAGITYGVRPDGTFVEW